MNAARTPDPLGAALHAIGARLAGISAAIGSVPGLLKDQADAALELATVARPERLGVLADEAQRRADVIASAVRETPFGLGTMTPLAAGYRSVAADVAAGRLA